MSYVEKHLIEGETVVYETRLHWIVLVGPVLLGLFIILPGLALLWLSASGSFTRNENSNIVAGAGTALIVVGFFFIVTGLLRRNATEVAVTNKRVVAKVGVAARRTIELLLSRVESIGVEETMMGRILGYGSVIVRGTGGTPESFHKIAHPLEFRTQVQRQIEKSQTK